MRRQNLEKRRKIKGFRCMNKNNILKFITVVVLFIFASCNLINKGIDVEVLNNAKTKVQNVKVYTTEIKSIVEFKGLNVYENVNSFLEMKNNIWILK